jgi:hypothetical protein
MNGNIATGSVRQVTFNTQGVTLVIRGVTFNLRGVTFSVQVVLQVKSRSARSFTPRRARRRTRRRPTPSRHPPMSLGF